MSTGLGLSLSPGFACDCFHPFNGRRLSGVGCILNIQCNPNFFTFFSFFRIAGKAMQLRGPLFILKETREFDLEYISLYRITGFIEWTIG